MRCGSPTESGTAASSSRVSWKLVNVRPMRVRCGPRVPAPAAPHPIVSARLSGAAWLPLGAPAAAELLPGWGLRQLATWHWLKVCDSGEPVGRLDIQHRRPYESLLLCWPAGLPAPPAQPAAASSSNSDGGGRSGFHVPGATALVVAAVPPAAHSRKPHLGPLLEPLLPPGARCLEVRQRGRGEVRGCKSCHLIFHLGSSSTRPISPPGAPFRAPACQRARLPSVCRCLGGSCTVAGRAGATRFSSSRAGQGTCCRTAGRDGCGGCGGSQEGRVHLRRRAATLTAIPCATSFQ